MSDCSPKKNKGFTLLEMLIVITIAGVLAAISIPSYSTHIERVRASEGVQLLTALLGAQERFRVENNAYATTIASLDIDIPNAANFNVPPTLCNDAARLAILARSDGTYTLCINSTGVVSCLGAANVCAQYAAGCGAACP